MARNSLARRSVRHSLIVTLSLMVVMGGAAAWLKLQENELVFATQRSRLHLIMQLPAESERVTVLFEHPEVLKSALAALLPAPTPSES